MYKINGMKVYTSTDMVVEGPAKIVKRTWRERLLTRPFRPFQATRRVQTWAPSKEVLWMPNGSVYMHPETLSALIAEKRKASYDHHTN